MRKQNNIFVKVLHVLSNERKQYRKLKSAVKIIKGDSSYLLGSLNIYIWENMERFFPNRWSNAVVDNMMICKIFLLFVCFDYITSSSL